MPPGRRFNPTLLFIVVAVTWALVEFTLSAPWIVTLLIAAAAVNALLWLHSRWIRRRTARALDPSRPYSREEQ